MKIIFFGSDDFALAHLEAIMASNHHVMATVTQPDRAKGRGLKLVSSPIKQKAVESMIPCFQPEKIKDPTIIKLLTSMEPDLFVVVAYGQILPSDVLNIPKKFCVNVHGSLLPQYRGAAPINWSILNGDKQTGITIMKMDAALDSGEIIAQKSLTIAFDETAPILRKRMIELGCELLVKTLDDIEADRACFLPQDKTKVTQAPKLTKELGQIHWDKPAKEIFNLVRGLLPWPTAYTFVKGKMLKILAAEVVDRKSLAQEIGTLVEIQKNGFVVACKDQALLVKGVHLEAANPMDAKSFLSGHKLEVGFKFS